jgi:hypothetical protein
LPTEPSSSTEEAPHRADGEMERGPSRKTLACLAALETYKTAVAEADRLTRTDVRAGARALMEALALLNRALGAGDLTVLRMDEMLADLPRGKQHKWAKPNRGGSGRLTDQSERPRIVLAVAAMRVIAVEGGVSNRDAAKMVAKAISKHRPKVTFHAVEQWGERIHEFAGSLEEVLGLIEELSGHPTEKILAHVADMFADAR